MLKILYITPFNPLSSNSGAKQRSKLFLEALCEIGYVDLVCFEKNDYPINSTNYKFSVKFFDNIPQSKKNKICKLINNLNILSIYSVYPKNKYCTGIISQILENNYYDFIVIRYLSTALMCGLIKNKKLIVDVDDLPEEKFSSLAKNNQIPFIRRIYYRLKSSLAKHYTKLFLKNIYHSFMPNKNQLLVSNSSYLPNIPNPGLNSEITQYKVFENLPHTVLFIGLLNYGPNYWGVDYFIKNIWEKIIEIVPGAVFKVIGRGLNEKKKKEWSKVKGVEVLGFVENIEKEYNNCRVVVVPIYHGAGTNIKVLEAMKMNTSVVASKYATRGFDDVLFDSKNILIAKNDIDFSKKVINLLCDKTLNESIRNNALNTINENFSFEKFKEVTKSIIH